MRALIARNWANRARVLDESYLSLCLRRIFQSGHDRHVDLRNPNPAGVDYIVVDHDGAVYYQGAIDGVVGSGTRAALRQFQQDYSLKETDTITPQVLDALKIAAR